VCNKSNSIGYAGFKAELNEQRKEEETRRSPCPV
jgi:hypothetical protein